MLKLTETAKKKLIELIELEDKNNSSKLKELTGIKVGFTLGYSEDKYDNRRTPDGKNEFFIGEKAGWTLHVLGHFFDDQEHVDRIYKPIDIEGLLFFTYGFDVPDALLDFNKGHLTANNEPVKIITASNN